MTTFLRAQAQRFDWRIAIFRIVAASMAAGLLLGDGIGIIAPWLDPAHAHVSPFQETLLRWSAAQRGAYAGILLAGSLLALLWRPQLHPLLLQFLLLAGAALAAIGAPFDPLTSSIQAAAIAALILTYPNRAALARFFVRSSSFSWPLLALSLLAATLLAFDAWHALQAGNQNAIATYTLAFALALAGLLTATKRPGWHVLGLLTGAALIYLGLVAARLPSVNGDWGIPGAALATLGGWAFVGATSWEMRQSRWPKGVGRSRERLH